MPISRAENTIGACPDVWDIDLRPLEISSQMPKVTGIPSTNILDLSRFMMNTYFYVNYPQSTYQMKMYKNRVIEGNPRTLVDFASQALSAKVKALGPDVAIYERWESSADGQNFAQLAGEQGGDGYAVDLESAISSDFYITQPTFSGAGFSVSNSSLSRDRLYPGMRFRLTLEVQVKGCPSPGIFSTNSVLVPRVNVSKAPGYEGLVELSTIYGLAIPNFNVQAACKAELSKISDTLQKRLNSKYPLTWDDYQFGTNSLCGSGWGFRDMGVFQTRLFDLDQTGCLYSKEHWSEVELMANSPCRIGIATTVEYFQRKVVPDSRKSLGTFWVVIDEITLNKEIPRIFDIGVIESFTPNTSYSDIRSFAPLSVEGERVNFTKSISGSVAAPLVRGDFVLVGPQDVCEVVPQSETERLLDIGIFRTHKEGICEFQFIFGGNEKFEPSTFVKQIKVKDQSVVTFKRTITCIKGKTLKKVTSFNPLCPKGYKKQK